MIDFITVIIPTLNPNADRLNRTIAGLKTQLLPLTKWELILVDNDSDFPIVIDLNWHPNGKIVHEPKRGLTFARMKGFDEAIGNLILLVDDDNILEESYLINVLNIFNQNAKIGAIGGKTLPDFEIDPPKWLPLFYKNLAIRDLGNNIITSKWSGCYPDTAPVGAGLAMRKASLENYINKIKQQNNPITDRQGKSLGSGGDNDIILEILKAGWDIGYFPSLTLQHIIPKERMQAEYLGRLNHNTNKSWVELLEHHDINPWKMIAGWTIPIRKARAWFSYKAWLNRPNYIMWKGACGLFDGLSNKHFNKIKNH